VIRLPLHTERLRVRAFEPERDAGPLHELWGDAEAMRFIPGGAKAGVDDTRARLETLRRRGRDGWGFWAIEERESGRLVGGVGVFPLNWEGPEFELGYHVVPSAWNRGYASEAAAAVLAAAWEAGLDHVVAVAMPGNVASRRVMEKLGMSLEGSTQYREFEVVRYTLVRPSDLDHKQAG
jgi:RimJ/RimL family protein N-acetyltransferase